jgi:hypothetical protein
MNTGSDRVKVYGFSISPTSVLHWLVILISSLVAITSGLFFLFSPQILPRIFSAFLFFGFSATALAMLCPRKTVINFPQKTVIVEKLFLGRWKIHSDHFRSTDFSSVILHYRLSDECYLGLNGVTGRKLWIKYFSKRSDESTSPEAESIALELSQAMQLPLEKVG